MANWKKYNARNVLDKVNEYIDGIDRTWDRRYRIREVCNDLSIFDWWSDYLSADQLKAMRSFLNTAIKMGFDGYVCFKVGAKGCTSGMWAYKKPTENGYSPDSSPCIYRSFYSSGNYYDACDVTDYWVSTDIPYKEINTVAKLKKAMTGLQFDEVQTA